MTLVEKNMQAPQRDDGNMLSPSETLASRAYFLIEEMIVTLTLEPGSAISEGQLSSALNIGRTPVREALHRLAQQGLVLISPRRGVFITEIRVDAQLRLLEVRRGLERLVAHRAALLASAEQRSEFHKLGREIKRTGTRQFDIAFLRLDRRFNQLLTDAAQNEFATAALNAIASLSRRFWHRYVETLDDWQTGANLHSNLAEAIARQDTAEAEKAADELMDYVEDFTRKILEQNALRFGGSEEQSKRKAEAG